MVMVHFWYSDLSFEEFHHKHTFLVLEPINGIAYTRHDMICNFKTQRQVLAVKSFKIFVSLRNNFIRKTFEHLL